MKQKANIIIGILFLLVIIIITILLLNLKNNNKDNDTYSKVKISNYEFSLNDKYQYKYLEEKKYGILASDKFLSSYIYISNETYSTLIKATSTYTNMGATELDSSLEEVKFGAYPGFINVKKVHYYDNNKDYKLVIILIKIEEEKTLVFQYESEIEEEENKILEDIKNSLLEIKAI